MVDLPPRSLGSESNGTHPAMCHCRLWGNARECIRRHGGVWSQDRLSPQRLRRGGQEQSSPPVLTPKNFGAAELPHELPGGPRSPRRRVHGLGLVLLKARGRARVTASTEAHQSEGHNKASE